MNIIAITTRVEPLPPSHILATSLRGDAWNVQSVTCRRGTHLGPFMGLAPTNKQLTWGLLLMDRIEAGKIVLHHANADWLGVLVKLGVVPAPPGTANRHLE